MDIFGFIGSLLGYLLWFLYEVFQNFGIAIIFFTIIVRMLMFPFNVKQQRSMAGQAKMAAKQKELRERCGKDTARYNAELQKLYDKEGVKPGAGCLNMVLPMFIMLGIYQAVISPLKNTLHLAGASVNEAVAKVQEMAGSVQLSQPELEIVRNWDKYKDALTMFTQEEVAKIENFSAGFNFLGWDLSKVPQEAAFMDLLWIIPLLSLVSSWIYTWYMSKTTTTQQVGCMKYTMYALPLLSAWWGFIFPAAVGFYWVISQLVSFVQSYFTQKFFSANHMATQAEASRFVTMEQKESQFVELEPHQQKAIADKIEQAQNPVNRQDKNTSNSKKKSNKVKKSNSDYLGNKK